MSETVEAAGREDRAEGQKHLRLHHVTVFVRDHERSLRFFVEQLGFKVVYDVTTQSGGRWVAIAPPDGAAALGLVAPSPDSPDYERIGRMTNVVFLTDDVAANVEVWKGRGVVFPVPPYTPAWGGTFAVFEDPDGNRFSLVGRDEVSQELDAQRRAAAEKQERARRAAQELEIATQVQARLFPQILPDLSTVDYAGACLPARAVGGDYYDFLDLGRGRVAFVVGDISGKGIGAALLMAHLQASLRSQCAIASARPEQFLRSVNRLFRENTSESAYATLFFGEYDDEARRLRYASCGHVPALLLHADGRLDRLASTSGAIGLFDDWSCSMEERPLETGDTLAVYTDGVTESLDTAGEEFGEERLVEALWRHHASPARAALESVLRNVRQWSAGEPQDDVTLILARALS